MSECGEAVCVSYIGGGHQNYIYNCNGNGIFSGTSNKICNSILSVVFGGDDNLITECNSVIGGGKQNCVMSNCSNILGGRLNSVSRAYSSVLGGQSNNVVGIHSGILGGCNNGISGSYSAILGGCHNTVSGGYSSVLGGSGNNIPASVNHAAVFGSGVTAVASNALHANQFVGQNMPPLTGVIPGLLQTISAPTSLGLPPGTLLVVTT